MDKLKEVIRNEIRTFIPSLIQVIAIYKDRGISEEDTKVKLIDPLLEKLGWDIRGDEVVRAYTIRTDLKPADYVLKVKDEPRLLIETKKLGDPLTLEDAVRVVQYGNTLRTSWCLLTNGDELRLYNSAWAESVEKQLFFELSVSSLKEEYEAKFEPFFDTLWLLSRESVEKEELDKEGIREYGKRVILEIWEEERTIAFICERARAKKVSDSTIRRVIKELEVTQLFPFPTRPSGEIIPEVVTPLEEIVEPSVEEIVTPTEEEAPPPPEEVEVQPPPEEVVTPPTVKEPKDYVHEESVKKAFEATISIIRKLGKDVIEEVYDKRLIYKVKDKVFVKLKPYKDYFRIDIFNPPTGRWISFDIEKENIGRLKARLDKMKDVYKVIRRK